MSNVKIICICNQFDSNVRIYKVNLDTDESGESRYYLLNNLAFGLQEQTKIHNNNEVLFVGDNIEFLKGLRETVLHELTLNYDNTNINIEVIGE